MTSGNWNLQAIGILPEFQNAGLGSALLSHLEVHIHGNHQRILLVETLGIPEFERTRCFYRARAFTEEARIRDFYTEGGHKKIVFSKRVSSQPR